MKSTLISLMVLIPVIASASDKVLDYCATVDSWAAQKVITAVTLQDRTLDPNQASSSLLMRAAVMEKSTPLSMGEWGQLYTQTIKILLPFKDVNKGSKTIIATSIISSEECSISEPSYLDMSLAEK
jgi:hypothetical protein